MRLPAALFALALLVGSACSRDARRKPRRRADPMDDPRHARGRPGPVRDQPPCRQQQLDDGPHRRSCHARGAHRRRARPATTPWSGSACPATPARSNARASSAAAAAPASAPSPPASAFADALAARGIGRPTASQQFSMALERYRPRLHRRARSPRLRPPARRRSRRRRQSRRHPRLSDRHGRPRLSRRQPRER